jgi:CTP:molybdopterin cytidylyltransferase MocA
MKCAAVICAAGAGARMGQNKALCRLEHESFLTSIVRVLKLMTAPTIHPIVVVTGAQADTVRHTHKALDVTWTYNPDWESTHMLESLTCGLQKVPDGYHVLHWPVDCVGVTPDDLQKLLDAPSDLCVALSYCGLHGHPIRITPACAEKLRSGQHHYSSLKDVFTEHTRTYIEASSEPLMNCNNPQILADFMARHPHL